MSRPAAPGRGFPDFLRDLFDDPLDPGYADAAARRARRGPRRPLARATAYLARLLALAIIGVLLAVAYREAIAAEPDRARAHAGLVNEVKVGQDRTDELQTNSDRLRRQVRAAEQAALGASAQELAQAREREAATGLAAVTGNGIVVELIDAPAPIDPQTGRVSGEPGNRVFDIDLQAVANGLWAAGAEAVAINGQRLTAVSTIRAAGNAILVDFRPVVSPYEVAAIGPPDLRRRFEDTPAAGLMREVAAQYGLSFSIRTEPSLQLPAAPGRSLRFAQPDVTPTPTIR